MCETPKPGHGRQKRSRGRTRTRTPSTNSYYSPQSEANDSTADELTVSLGARNYFRMDWHVASKSRIQEKKAE